jgi:hypothetical protein
MAQLSLLDRTARGLVAGVAGTAAMTAWQELSAKLRSSDDGAKEGREDGAEDPWAAAPAPAKVGRMILGGLGYEVPAGKIGLLTNVMHWGYGTSWGAVYGAVMGNAARGRPLARGLAFGTWVWAMSYVQMVPLGLYELPWKYSPQVLALDLSYHLAYGAGLGAAGALVER